MHGVVRPLRPGQLELVRFPLNSNNKQENAVRCFAAQNFLSTLSVYVLVQRRTSLALSSNLHLVPEPRSKMHASWGPSRPVHEIH
jgi:hypothetical protein